MRWFSADLHFGHANILSLSNRPFKNVDEMNRAIIDNWNSVVSPTDEAWILGDVALGTIADTLPLVQQLNGTKHLIAGNHDRCWGGNSRIRPIDVYRYFAAGFASIADEAWLSLDSVTVMLSHFPYHGDSQPEDRHSEHRPEFRGFPLLHGHVHEKWRVMPVGDTVQFNVGVDVNGFTPVSETEVLEVLG